jgi:hypothetical protein
MDAMHCQRLNMRLLLATGFLLLCCSVPDAQPAPSPYNDLMSRIDGNRRNFGKSLATAAGEAQDSVIARARAYLASAIIDSLFGFWFGTPWDFYGTTKIPGQGKIACGYFVTAVLSDAGLKIPRRKWAEVASETMIKAATADIKRFHNRPIEDVETYITKKGEGMYIVGLDCHVGFIVHYRDSIRFVHSNYYHPETGVMSEPLKGQNPLNDSKYRVIGKILDNAMVKKWIRGEKIGVP